ncbi:MAG TPA: divalent metal cation transporter [Usitatibacter sp.]|nr:divalent metal cation transporter [Usitatibacter sp.]
MKIWDLFLGIMSAIGGNVDMGQLVFTIAGGALFDMRLLWVVIVATVGIVVYAEMSGRVAVVVRRPAFELMRESLGPRMGLVVLVASTAVNILTCTAQVGGIAAILQFLLGGNYHAMMVLGAALLLAAVGFLKFDWIDRTFGFLGLALLVYVAVAVSLQPDWGKLARGLVPSLPGRDMPGMATYAYYVVGLFSAILMPYEIHFYSSGAIEEKWGLEDLPSNFANSVAGFALGGVLTVGLIVCGAQAFFGKGIDPHLLGTAAIPAAMAYGVTGLLVALVGILSAIGGAAVETALASAYSIAQFLRQPWGKDRKLRDAPLYHASWMVMLLAGLGIASTGVNAVDIVEYSVIFAVVVLPFTYYPILRVADDRETMGRHVNGPAIRALGWLYLVLITIAALAAVPLMVITHSGAG